MVMMRALVSNIADKQKSNHPFFNGKDKAGFINFDTVLDLEKDKSNEFIKADVQNEKENVSPLNTDKENENSSINIFNEKPINGQQNQGVSFKGEHGTNSQDIQYNEETLIPHNKTEDSANKEDNVQNESVDYPNNEKEPDTNFKTVETTKTEDEKVQETSNLNPEKEQSNETNFFEQGKEENSTIKEENNGNEVLNAEYTVETKANSENENDSKKPKKEDETIQSESSVDSKGDLNEKDSSQHENMGSYIFTKKSPEKNEEDQDNQTVISDGFTKDTTDTDELQAEESKKELSGTENDLNKGHNGESDLQATEESKPIENQAEIEGVKTNKAPGLNNENECLMNISELPDSAFKYVALGAYNSITADGISSRKNVNIESWQKETEINQHFGNLKMQMTSAFEDRFSNIVLFLTGQKQYFNMRAMSAISNLLNAAGNTISTGVSAISNAGMKMVSFVSGLGSLVSQGILKISSVLGNLVNSVPIPNIPGVGSIRHIVTGMINKAISSVQSASLKFATILNKSLASGMASVFSRLNIFMNKVNLAISRTINTAQGFLAKSINLLNRLITRISTLLRSWFYYKALKFISGVKRKIVLSIRRLRYKTIAKIVRNTKKHIARLFAIVWVENNKSIISDNDSNTVERPNMLIKAVVLIRKSAKEINSANLAIFRFKLNGLVNSVYLISRIFSVNLLKAIWSLRNSYIPKIAAFVAGKINKLYNTVKQGAGVVRSRLTWLMSAVYSGVFKVISFIRSKAQQITDTTKNVAVSAKDLIVRRVRDFLMGT
jgi:hypothetical protein